MPDPAQFTTKAGAVQVAASKAPPPPTDDDDLSDLLDTPLEHQPAPPPAPPKPPKAAPPARHDDHLLELAEYYGFDAVDVQRMTPDQLSREVNKATRRELLQRTRRGQWADPQPAAPQPAVQQPAVQQPAPAAAPVDQFELTEDEYDPKLVAALKAQQRRIAELEAAAQRSGQSEQQRVIEMAHERIDNAFASIGAAELYGDGTVHDFPRGSAEMMRRQAVLQLAKIDLRHVPPAKVLLNKLKAAHDVLYPAARRAEPEPAAEEPVSPYMATFDVPARRPSGPARDERGRFLPQQAADEYPTEEQWGQAGLRRPTQRTAPDPTKDRGQNGYADPDEFDIT